MSISAAPAAIAGAFLLTLPAFEDDRGFFKETYVRSKFAHLGIEEEFIQDNVSFSKLGVVRGLHGDPLMSKLVQVLHGNAFDVIVDARRGSPTFGRWESFDLSGDNHRQVYVPAGCLHGFQALSDGVVLSYKQSAQYDPSREIGVRWDDPALGIGWPLRGSAIVSAKDARNGSFLGVVGAPGGSP